MLKIQILCGLKLGLQIGICKLRPNKPKMEFLKKKNKLNLLLLF